MAKKEVYPQSCVDCKFRPVFETGNVGSNVILCLRQQVAIRVPNYLNYRCGYFEKGNPIVLLSDLNRARDMEIEIPKEWYEKELSSGFVFNHLGAKVYADRIEVPTSDEKNQVKNAFDDDDNDPVTTDDDQPGPVTEAKPDVPEIEKTDKGYRINEKSGVRSVGKK